MCGVVVVVVVVSLSLSVSLSSFVYAVYNVSMCRICYCFVVLEAKQQPCNFAAAGSKSSESSRIVS